MNSEINIKVKFLNCESARMYHKFIYEIFDNLPNCHNITCYTYSTIAMNYQLYSVCHIRVPYWIFQHIGVLFPPEFVLDSDDDPML